MLNPSKTAIACLLLLFGSCAYTSEAFAPSSVSTNGFNARAASLMKRSVFREPAEMGLGLGSLGSSSEEDFAEQIDTLGAMSHAPLQKRVLNLDAFVRYQPVLLTVLAVVASTTMLHQHHIIPDMMERDMLAGTFIFSLGDVGAQLLTHFREALFPSSEVVSSSSQNLVEDAANADQNVNDEGFQNLFKAQDFPDFELDVNRLIVAVLLGAVWAGIGNPFVYSTVEDLLPGGGSLPRVLLKMLITCSFLSTVGNYFTLFSRRMGKTILDTNGNMMLRGGFDFGRELKFCIESCNRDFLHVLKDDVKIWPLYDILCYSVIPPSVRPLTSALMATVWSMYMSIASANEETAEDPLLLKKATDVTVVGAESGPMMATTNNINDDSAVTSSPQLAVPSSSTETAADTFL